MIRQRIMTRAKTNKLSLIDFILIVQQEKLDTVWTSGLSYLIPACTSRSYFGGTWWHHKCQMMTDYKNIARLAKLQPKKSRLVICFLFALQLHLLMWLLSTGGNVRQYKKSWCGNWALYDPIITKQLCGWLEIDLRRFNFSHFLLQPTAINW